MNSLKTILLIGFTLLLVLPAFAQGGPPRTPIDGGLTVLLAAGGVYGLKKIRDHRNSN